MSVELETAGDERDGARPHRTRRAFLGGAAVAGAGRLLAGPLLAARAGAAAPSTPCRPDPPGIPVGAIAVAPDGTVWTADIRGTTINARRGRALERRGEIDVAGAPLAIAIAPDGHTAAVTTAFWDRPGLAVADLRTGEAERVDAGAEPRDVAFARDGRIAWVIGSGREGTLTKVDTRALRAGKPIALGAHPRGIALHPDGRHALVALNSAPGAVLLVDIENGRVTRRIATHDFPYRIAISADGRHALVSHSGVGADTVTPLDLQRHRTGRRIRTGADPAGVAFAGPGATALVANTAAGTVAFVDTVAGRRTRTVRVGGAPAAIAAGRGRAYVADLLTGHVTAIRTGVFA